MKINFYIDSMDLLHFGEKIYIFIIDLWKSKSGFEFFNAVINLKILCEHLEQKIVVFICHFLGKEHTLLLQLF